MGALAINNLSTVADMNAIRGGGEVKSVYTGSHIINGSWSYRGTRYRFKGFAFSRRYGLLRVYDKKRIYKRTQTKHYHYNSYWT